MYHNLQNVRNINIYYDRIYFIYYVIKYFYYSILKALVHIIEKFFQKRNSATVKLSHFIFIAIVNEIYLNKTSVLWSKQHFVTIIIGENTLKSP